MKNKKKKSTMPANNYFFYVLRCLNSVKPTLVAHFWQDPICLGISPPWFVYQILHLLYISLLLKKKSQDVNGKINLYSL